VQASGFWIVPEEKADDWGAFAVGSGAVSLFLAFAVCQLKLLVLWFVVLVSRSALYDMLLVVVRKQKTECCKLVDVASINLEPGFRALFL
jgi:hypothetical protein